MYDKISITKNYSILFAVPLLIEGMRA